ncbi:uncharacterized protein BJX67DRAFT_341090 [Aspergillus lucknowensis]|uniref:Uncharacterized protein n=1 Tax=Aspergillus lucknowensis TaxID=176173 RepID=A0ABR4M5S4_9EURO
MQKTHCHSAPGSPQSSSQLGSILKAGLATAQTHGSRSNPLCYLFQAQFSLRAVHNDTFAIYFGLSSSSKPIVNRNVLFLPRLHLGNYVVSPRMRLVGLLEISHGSMNADSPSFAAGMRNVSQERTPNSAAVIQDAQAEAEPIPDMPYESHHNKHHNISRVSIQSAEFHLLSTALG